MCLNRYVASGGVPRRNTSCEAQSWSRAACSIGCSGAMAHRSSWENSRPMTAPICAPSLPGPSRSRRAISEPFNSAGSYLSNPNASTPTAQGAAGLLAQAQFAALMDGVSGHSFDRSNIQPLIDQANKDAAAETAVGDTSKAAFSQALAGAAQNFEQTGSVPAGESNVWHSNGDRISWLAGSGQFNVIDPGPSQAPVQPGSFFYYVFSVGSTSPSYELRGVSTNDGGIDSMILPPDTELQMLRYYPDNGVITSAIFNTTASGSTFQLPIGSLITDSAPSANGLSAIGSLILGV